MSDLCSFDQITRDDRDAVGGKALSLAEMARAGLPVPPGFCVTTAAYRRLEEKSPETDSELSAQIIHAYHTLGGGPVAVRSSAPMEDSTAASFAGQHETILGIQDESELLAAIGRCWNSLHSDRAAAYRRWQGVEDDAAAMAVVVQRLIEAEIAGVLFTRDPLDREDHHMLIEAAPGQGENVVAGRITPDRYRVDRQSGIVVKREMATTQDHPCLDDARLAELAELGRRVEALYRQPCDVEWAWAQGRFWLLQARPITTPSLAEREQVRQEEIALLAEKARAGPTVWSRYNLVEVLPKPTPMTWAIVRRMLSGQGGMGRMYRDFGIVPNPSLDDECVYDLICGRPYCNLRREPSMVSNGLPLEHSFAALKAAPQKALYPRARPNPANAGWRFWLFLPLLFVRAARAQARLHSLSLHMAEQLQQAHFPAWTNTIATEAARDLHSLTSSELVNQFHRWCEFVIVQMARESLKPTVLASFLLGNLEKVLIQSLGPQATRAALAKIMMGVHHEADADLPQALRDLNAGQLARADFLERFGHRGLEEMELAQPRWSEDPGALQQFARTPSQQAMESPPEQTWTPWKIAEQARLTTTRRAALDRQIRKLRSYLALRETAKNYFMKGYALLRGYLMELDRRYHLRGGIFYLFPGELTRLVSGEDFSSVIAGRKRRRTIALTIEVPPVIFSDDLETIGRPKVPSETGVLQGVPLSAGVAEGPVLILHEPSVSTLPSEPFILVCPSTDPAWVPLFLRARGLIMETGGVLSHGAIVARELGLPAVAGIPGILRILQNGQRVGIDGATGTIIVSPTEQK